MSTIQVIKNKNITTPDLAPGALANYENCNITLTGNIPYGVFSKNRFEDCNITIAPGCDVVFEKCIFAHTVVMIQTGGVGFNDCEFVAFSELHIGYADTQNTHFYKTSFELVTFFGLADDMKNRANLYIRGGNIYECAFKGAFTRVIFEDQQKSCDFEASEATLGYSNAAIFSYQNTFSYAVKLQYGDLFFGATTPEFVKPILMYALKGE